MSDFDSNWAAKEESKRDWLAEHGMYAHEEEHSSCGVGLVVSIDGKPSRKVVQAGIDALKAIWHDSRHAWTLSFSLLTHRVSQSWTPPNSLQTSMQTFLSEVEPRSSVPGTGRRCFLAYSCLEARPKIPFAGLTPLPFCHDKTAFSVLSP